jgi:6-hydroxynicotinate 3-monooxygenase
MRHTTKIAVIGAGLGGMTAAGLLQRHGFSVKVYEQAPAFSRIGAGIHLSSNVMLVMRRLRHREGAVRYRPASRRVRQPPMGHRRSPVRIASGSRERSALRRRLHQRPSRRSARRAGIRARSRHDRVRKKARDIDQTGQAIRLDFEDGDRAETDLVIGADGVNSKVREFLLGPEKPRYTGHIAHRAIFPTALLNGLPIRACTKWWGPGNHILVYYMTQTREEVYIVTSAPQSEWTADASFVPCDRDEFIATFDGYHPELRQVVAAAPEVTKWPVFDREPVDIWSGGRIVLLGDACHPLRPYMAAGAAMAIEDAAILARCIAAFGQDGTEESFAWYEANRKPRVGEVQRISLANTWLRTPVNPDWLFCYDACAVPLVEPGRG